MIYDALTDLSLNQDGDDFNSLTPGAVATIFYA